MGRLISALFISLYMMMDRPIGWTTLEEAKELKKLGLEKETSDLWYSSYCLSAPP